MAAKFSDQLAADETILYQNARVNAKIPQGKGHKSVPGALYVTTKRIVHEYKGLFGMGATRHQIPIRLVSTVSTSLHTTGRVEIATLDGKTTRFMLKASDAREVAELIQNQQAEQQL